jgi:hypothetical protein
MEFLECSQQSQGMIKVGKTMASMSTKHGCQKSFITKQPYFNNNICHTNKWVDYAMGKMFFGFRHALGS